jgi:magnesium-protoporphyrin O-methyltransferase
MPKSCCSTSGFDHEFDEANARAELRALHRKGPGRSSQAIVDALAGVSGGPQGRTVLDIGGGVGAVHFGLLERGAAGAIDVDASQAYIDTARSEAERRGLGDRVSHRYGDFVTLAREVEAADLVALDRVVCCYGDVDALVGLAAARTRRRLAITIPPDTWVFRLAGTILNTWYRLIRNEYRAFVHPHGRVTAAARGAGLEPTGPTRTVGVWRLLVFDRPIRTADSSVS